MRSALRGARTVAAALTDGARDADRLSLSADDCVVIGNEGHGLSAAALEACDTAAILPWSAAPALNRSMRR